MGFLSPDLFLHALDGFIESMYHNSRADLTFGQNYEELVFTQPQNENKLPPVSKSKNSFSFRRIRMGIYHLHVSLNHRAQHIHILPYICQSLLKYKVDFMGAAKTAEHFVVELTCKTLLMCPSIMFKSDLEVIVISCMSHT